MSARCSSFITGELWREEVKEGKAVFLLSTSPLISKVSSRDCIGEESYSAVYTCQSEDLLGADTEGFVEDCCFVISVGTFQQMWSFVVVVCLLW